MSHVPVLLQEVIETLDPKPGQIILDGTIGFAGHGGVIADKLGSTGIYIGLDRDQKTLTQARLNLEGVDAKVLLLEGNYRYLDEILSEQDISSIDGFLLDLGFNSDQLVNSGRGFSFQQDEPLIMTYESEITDRSLTARDIVNHYSEKDIADILYNYGEESFSRQIAKKILTSRLRAPIETTGQLVEIILASVPLWYQKRRIHPATKTFQALRIAVNDELGALEEGLTTSWQYLNLNGKIAIITFHSLEAKIVKNFFKNKKSEGLGELINKKVIKPKYEESKINPRARSAQLRVIKKIK